MGRGWGGGSLGQSSFCLAMPWGAALPRGIGVVLTDFHFLLQCLGLRLRASLVGPYSHRKGPEALVLMAWGEPICI